MSVVNIYQPRKLLSSENNVLEYDFSEGKYYRFRNGRHELEAFSEKEGLGPHYIGTFWKIKKRLFHLCAFFDSKGNFTEVLRGEYGNENKYLVQRENEQNVFLRPLGIIAKPMFEKSESLDLLTESFFKDFKPYLEDSSFRK